MKRINCVFVLILLYVFSACSNEGDSLKLSDLPSGVQTFIDYNIPDYTVSDIVLTENPTEKYIVYFTEDLTVGFDGDGNWQWFRSETSLPVKLQEFLIDNPIEFFNELYNGVAIRSISSVSYGYRAILTNEIILAKIFGYNELAEDLTETPDDLPLNARGFISNEEFTNQKEVEYILKIDEYKECFYRVVYKNGLEIEFNEEGNWTYYKTYPRKVPTAVIELLPIAVRQCLKDDPGINVYGIQRYDAYVELLIGENSYKIVDPDTGVSIIPYSVVYDYIEKHFFETSHSSSLLRIRTPDIIVYECVFETASTTINMLVDKWGTWMTISVSGKPIPQTILDELPSSIRNYLKENYPAEPIQGIDRRNNEYILVTQDEILKFDGKGNLMEANPVIYE